MILFQTSTNHKIDLSRFGVTLKEENSLFTNNIYKSYSLPFNLPAEEELMVKLGLPHLDNITNVNSKVMGKILLTDRYYDAIMFLGNIEGRQIDCSLSFGDQELSVYDLKLSDLPWPVQLVNSYFQHVNGKIQKTWPDTAYNYPRVYAPSIAEESGYESFKGFINNYDGLGPMLNTVDNTGAEPVYHNYNVFAPMPYLLEILRFIYLQEGRKVTGELFEDEIMKKAIYIPENFLEKFRGSEYSSFSFNTPTEVINNEFGVYKKEFTPENIGSYEVDYKLNLDPVTAEYFEFRIYQKDSVDEYIKTTYFEATSTKNRVSLSDKQTINVTAENQYDPIVIELKLKYKADTIAPMNQFEFSFSEGKLNEGPSSFTLADFMPNMKAGEFVNEMKNWLNLDISIFEDRVRIDYVQNSILKKPRENHSHLEIPYPKKKHNSNRFYKLSYANGERLFYNRNGQVFSDIDEEGADVIPIDMDVQPAAVEQNENVITAVKPEKASKIDFCLYEYASYLDNTCPPELGNQLNLQKVSINNWLEWLFYRVNSKTFKESFECSVHERINIDELSFKYNELHVIKSLMKKYLSESVMRVDVESETF